MPKGRESPAPDPAFRGQSRRRADPRAEERALGAVPLRRCLRQASGVRYLDAPLRKFGAGGGVAEVAIGIDSGGTSFEAASQLAGAVRGDGRLLITTEIGSASFHPKLYAFSSRRRQKAVAVVGSSNLTQGGLFDNHECSTVFSLDLAEDEDAALLSIRFAQALPLRCSLCLPYRHKEQKRGKPQASAVPFAF
ncbi:MAG TPA: phospholipase D family protein [Solirubrobacterales bacterium]|nr:phospholipase D family protein [Solirubrobacterales bacterium]